MSEANNYGEWDRELETITRSNGGWVNMHAHLDRANTFGPEFLAHVNTLPTQAATQPLRAKQDLTGNLHLGLAYQEGNLRERIGRELERAVSFGTRAINSFIDVSPVDIGLRAVQVALDLRDKFRGRIEFQVAAYPIFGISKPARWELFLEAAKMSDCIGTLPSRDARGDGIGSDAHFQRIIRLAQDLGKPVYFQVDQDNDPEETETERLIQAVHWLGSPKAGNTSGPTVWAVHAISPSCYEESRFQKLIEGLLRENIGVVCCPSAAISMRQLRSKSAPIHNSIARILDMLEAGVPVRFGTDNICDVFIPSGDGKIASEIWLASNLLRFYDTFIWAKVGAGLPLNNTDRDAIKRVIS